MPPVSRRPVRAGGLRPLNQPVPLEVRLDEAGTPTALLLGGAWREVSRPRNRWRSEGRWWREEGAICRMYWQVELADGRLETLFQDRFTGQWYRQRYP
jgi:hypothetical protein